MCVVSMIGDHYTGKWQEPYERWHQQGLTQVTNGVLSFISKEEFEDLKKEVKEMKELLIKAKLYDEKNNEPSCEVENKVEVLKKIAELVGVSLEDVFKDK